MIDHEKTIELILLAQSGDKNAKNTLIEENIPLIKSIVKRFKGRLEYDDLMQLGAMGFTKAMLCFDTSFGVRFSTYAVPMITGEIKRFLRDDGIVKVSRWAKVLYQKIAIYLDDIHKNNLPEPTVDELALHFECDKSDIIFALDTSKYVLSLNETTSDDDDSTLGEKIPDNNTPESKIDEIMLKDSISSLPDREKKIIILRYYRDKTQSEVASMLGISQVQVSRIENKTLQKIKEDIE